MNKKNAKVIAETITNEEIQIMFDNAKKYIADWTAVSNVNKGMTKGAAWNILASDFNLDTSYHNMSKVNMLREFGDFLSGDLKPKPTPPPPPGKPPVHVEPIFK